MIGLDKPATGAAVLEQAHNDWLEWASTSGIDRSRCANGAGVGCSGGVSAIRDACAGFASSSDIHWPAPQSCWSATALHEIVGFGLQSPLNRYLLAAWVGLVWGVWGRVELKGRGRCERLRFGESPAPRGRRLSMSSYRTRTRTRARIRARARTRTWRGGMTEDTSGLGGGSSRHLRRMRVMTGIVSRNGAGGHLGRLPRCHTAGLRWRRR